MHSKLLALFQIGKSQQNFTWIIIYRVANENAYSIIYF